MGVNCKLFLNQLQLLINFNFGSNQDLALADTREDRQRIYQAKQASLSDSERCSGASCPSIARYSPSRSSSVPASSS